MQTGKRGMLACRIIEDEINEVIDRCQPENLDVVWIDRGYHNYPDTLREYLQMHIDRLDETGYDEILLAYGLCGKGAEDLVSKQARLVIPKFDDCLNLMLCTGPRSKRALCRGGVMYLTQGWCQDEGAMLQMHERYVEKYGKRRGDRLMRMMFDSYNSVCVIDTGCYDLDPVREYARQCADMLDLDLIEEPGGNAVLENLIMGNYDENIIVHEPGEPITMDDFEVVEKG